MMSDIQPHSLSTPDVGVSLDEVRHVGIIEIRRPPHNYFDIDVLTRVVEISYKLAEAGARALVLCTEGKNYCAGADFSTEDMIADGGRNLYDIGICLLEQPLPIVTAIQGKSVGGGVGLALVADFRIASPESSFWINFAQIGIHHGFGMSVTLPLAVGPQKALELLYTGRSVSGDEAHRIGLCDYLVPADEVRGRSFALAAEIASAAPLATREIRATMRGRLAEQVRESMLMERAIQVRLTQTADFVEGTTAVRERRQPTFTAT